MRRYHRISLAVIAALAFLTQSGCQQETKSQDVSKAEGAPKITFEKTVYDFGEVSSTRNYTGQFKFTNTGNGVLKIIGVKKCCGTVVTLDKEELAPGESGTLKVDYNTGRNSGLMSRQIYVFSNDKTNPKVALTIKAKIVIRVDYQPQRIDLLLNKENAACPKITITSFDKQPFSITAFQSTGDTIAADIDPSVKATEFVLEPKVYLEKLQKHPKGLVTINLTHPQLNKVYIRFNTKQRFQLIPSGVFLLNPRPLEPSINRVSVLSNYSEDFEIASTSSEKDMAKVVSQRAIKDGYQLNIEVTPPAPEGETRSFEDVVDVNLKGGQTLKIKCYVRYLSKDET
jgi:hypothetical protein